MTALRALITLSLAAFVLAITVPPIFMTPPHIESGVTAMQRGAWLQPNFVRISPNSPAFRAGLGTGDVLACLSVRDHALLVRETRVVQHGYTPGTPLETCVRRGSALQSVQFIARAGPPIAKPYGTDFLGALRVVVVLIFLFTGIALVMTRPTLMTWIFFMFCLGNAPVFPAQRVWTTLPSWQFAITEIPGIFTGVSPALLLAFSLIVPNDRVPQGWRRVAFGISVCMVALLLVAVLMRNYDTGTPGWANVANLLDEVMSALTVMVVLARLLTMQRADRARFGWAAFAILFGIIMNDLRNVLATFESNTAQIVSIVAAELTVVTPLALIYAILKRHVIDVRFVISRAVVYATLTTLVVGVIGIVDWATSQYLSQMRLALAIDAAVTIGVAFLLHRTYAWIERAVDFMLFRVRHDAENYLYRLARSLLRADREETVDRAVVQAPYEKLDLTMTALFRADGNLFTVCASAGSEKLTALVLDSEHELVRFLAAERFRVQIGDLRRNVSEQFEAYGASPALAIPMFQGDALGAFAVFGNHRDGTRLDPDEIETLERLCEMASQAYVRIELLRYRSAASQTLISPA